VTVVIVTQIVVTVVENGVDTIDFDIVVDNNMVDYMPVF
jgi:hypothetical protein